MTAQMILGVWIVCLVLLAGYIMVQGIRENKAANDAEKNTSPRKFPEHTRIDP